MTPDRRTAAASVIALVAGFALSFLGVGLLWIAMAWTVQALMLVPFAVLTFGLARWSGHARQVAGMVVLGMLPLGALLTQFRNREGSHLAPTVVVLAWVAGVALGAWLGRRAKPAD